MVSTSVYGAKQAKKEVTLQKNMQSILKSFSALVPYIYNGKSLNDESFIKSMDQFETVLKKTNHYGLLEQENLKPNLKIIRDAMQQYTESAKQKNFYFAKRGLKTIAAKCVSCHSQLPSNVYGKIQGQYNKFLNTQIRSSYDQAMMAYLLRDYKKAIEKFSVAVKEYQHDPQIQDRSIRKVLKISLMQNFDLKKTQNNLNLFTKQVKPGTHLAENITLWSKQLKAFKLPTSGKGVSSMVNEVLGPIEDEVRVGDPNLKRIPLHYMQGVLSRNMAVSTKDKPMSLYWLGIIENSFHEDFMFSLGDMYLKTCVKKYSNSPFAKKCYKALEDNYVLGFTGSSGTSLPADVKEELLELKKYIEVKKVKK